MVFHGMNGAAIFAPHSKKKREPPYWLLLQAKDFVFSGRKRLFWLFYSCTTSLKCRHNQGYYYCSLKIMTRNEMSDISSLFLPLSYDVTPSPPFWLPWWVISNIEVALETFLLQVVCEFHSILSRFCSVIASVGQCGLVWVGFGLKQVYGRYNIRLRCNLVSMC